uniref:Calmodulin n=1 Tax=Florenciella parvula TaxID=236787 RepID=A0A7S2F8U8_9STRA|mmetsp:Transcript_11147/g.23335  ORF Transcript_11147/g.23335 Transcript_11147/m.23335 type:complete len:2901 (+) Transcript_11147:210-8912(+)
MAGPPTAGRRYGVRAKVGMRKACRVKWSPADEEQKGPFQVSTFMESLVELKTKTVELNPEDEDSGFVRIAVLPQPEPCSKTIEVTMRNSTGYSEVLAFEVTYFIPASAGSPKKAAPKRKKTPMAPPAPVNPAAAPAGSVAGSDATDVALAVTDSLLNLSRMEVEQVRQTIEQVRNSPTHSRPTTPVRDRGGASMPGSLRGALGRGMGVGDLEIEFGDQVTSKKTLNFEKNPELEGLKKENNRLKSELERARLHEEAENQKKKADLLDYVDGAHPWDFVMVFPAPAKQENPAKGAKKSLHHLANIPDLIFTQEAVDMRERIHQLGLVTGETVSLKGNLLMKIRAPLHVLKKYAAKIEYKMKLDESALQHRVEAGWPEHKVNPMLAVTYAELSATTFEDSGPGGNSRTCESLQIVDEEETDALRNKLTGKIIEKYKHDSDAFEEIRKRFNTAPGEEHTNAIFHRREVAEVKLQNKPERLRKRHASKYNDGSEVSHLVLRHDYTHAVVHAPQMLEWSPFEYIYGPYKNEQDPEMQRLFENAHSHPNPFGDRVRLFLLNQMLYEDHRLGLQKRLKKGDLCSFFPLHNIGTLHSLRLDWTKEFAWPWKGSLMSPPWILSMEPLERVRDYYGEKITLYFAFLGWYTSWLVVICIPATVVTIIYYVPTIDPSVKSIVLPIYAIVLQIWAMLMLLMWKKEENVLAAKWGATFFEDDETERPSFNGDTSWDFVGSGRRRHLRGAESSSPPHLLVLFTLIVVVTTLIGSVYLMHLILTQAEGPGWSFPEEYIQYVTAVMTAVMIELMNQALRRFAINIVNAENHRTDTQYEDSLISKVFTYQFINSYAPLYYVAFVQGRAGIDVTNGCEGYECTDRIALLVVIIMVVHSAFNNIPDLVRSMFLAAPDSDDEDRDVAEQEWNMLRYDPILGPLEDNEQVALQFGYTILFGAAAPWTPLVSFVANHFELRLDTKSLLHVYQRPVPRGAQDIGTWYAVFFMLVGVGIVTNSALVFFSVEDIGSTWKNESKVWAFFLSQYFIFATIFVIKNAIPNGEEQIKFQVKRAEVWSRRILGREKWVDDEDLPKSWGSWPKPPITVGTLKDRATVPKPPSVYRTYCFFTMHSGFRSLCDLIARSKTFDNFILLCIGFNTITLTLTDYSPECCDDDGVPMDEGCALNEFNASVEPFLTWTFAFEFVVKSVAMGMNFRVKEIYHKETKTTEVINIGYLSDHWNKLDFFVVCVSLAQVIPGMPNMSVLRTFRVLRPLKSVQKFPGLKRIITGLFDSAPRLAGVVMLLTFFLIFFSIMALQSFSGVLNRRCRLTPYPLQFATLHDGTFCDDAYADCWEDYLTKIVTNYTNYKCIDDWTADGSTKEDSIWYNSNHDCFWPANLEEGRVCSPKGDDGGGMFTCQEAETQIGWMNNTWCGSDYDSWGNPRFLDSDAPYGMPRNQGPMFSGDFNFGFTTFDNILASFTTIFQSVSMEGWTDVMYMTMDSYGVVTSFILFVLLVVLGSFFVLNLVLGVLSDSVGGDEAEPEPEWDLDSDVNHHAHHASPFTAAKADSPKEGPAAAKPMTQAKSRWLGLKAVVTDEIDSKAPAPGGGMAEVGAVVEMGPKLEEGEEEEDDDDEVKRKKCTLRSVIDGPGAIIALAAVLLNTVVLALDQYPANVSLAATLDEINLVLTYVFIGELVIKLYAYGLKDYFADAFNNFDFVVVVVSIVELVLERVVGYEGGGISALRAFRIFRVFKLAKQWKDLNDLLSKMLKTLNDIGYFAMLLVLFMYIYSLVGMQFFANKMHFNPDSGWPVPFSRDDENEYYDADVPEANFDNFLWAMVTVFQMLTGENWNSVMYDGRRASLYSEASAFYFLSLIVIGAFIVMNMFLAILLSNFSEEEEEEEPEEPMKNKGDDIPDFETGFGWLEMYLNAEMKDVLKEKDGKRLKKFKGEQGARENIARHIGASTKTLEGIEVGKWAVAMKQIYHKLKQNPDDAAELDNTFAQLCTEDEEKEFWSERSSNYMSPEQRKRLVDAGLLNLGPAPNCCSKFVESSIFKNFILSLISIQSVVLAIETPLDNPDGQKATILTYVGYFCVGGFFLEAVLQIIGQHGFSNYWVSPWNRLDMFLLSVSLIEVASHFFDVGFDVSALAIFGVLKPVRLVNRSDGLKLMFEALGASIGPVANVVMVVMLFFLIFAVVGVSYFKGTLYECSGDGFDALSDAAVDLLTYPVKYSELTSSQIRMLTNTSMLHDDPETAMLYNASTCLNYNNRTGTHDSWSTKFSFQTNDEETPTSRDMCDCMVGESKWNHVGTLGFDNIFAGMACLYEISTTEGWVDVMFAAINSRGIDMQPVRDANLITPLVYFILFMLIGCFFCMELFVGVVIDKFNKIRTSAMEERGVSGKQALMTDKQAEASMDSDILMKLRPHRVRKVVVPAAYMIAENKLFPFDTFILSAIMLNAITMAAEYFGMPTWYSDLLDTCNLVFVGIFTFELVVKILGSGLHSYFLDSWNRFDAFIMFVTYFDLVADRVDIPLGAFDSITSKLRIFRLFRFVRVIRKNKTLNEMWETFVTALPSLWNALVLISLVFFVYGVLAVKLFAKVGLNDDLNSHAHFQNLGFSLLTLFRFSTGENWNGFMHSVMDQPAGCELNPEWNNEWCIVPQEVDCVPLNGCPNQFTVYAYFYSFTMLVSFVMINLFVGVIMTAMESLGEDGPEQPVKEKYRKAFYDRWAMDQFDPDCKGWIRLSKLEMFIKDLGKPMRKAAVTLDLTAVLLAMEIHVRESQVDHDDLGDTELHISDVFRGLELHVMSGKMGENKKKLENMDLTEGDKEKVEKDNKLMALGRAKFFTDALKATKVGGKEESKEADMYKQYTDRLKSEDEDDTEYLSRVRKMVPKVPNPETAWVIPQYLIVEGGNMAHPQKEIGI